MGFFSFQLTRVDPQSIRSRTTDVDLLTFGVLVNGRDQGHGYAVIPMWPGRAVESASFNEGAANNGHPYGRNHMSEDWVIGPLFIEETDKVEVLYTATNFSDSNLPSMSQQEADQWVIKMVNIYYSVLVGEFISSLGLKAIAEYIFGATAAGAVAAFLADPVGTLLGFKRPGQCNGTVYSAKQTFTGATLAALPSSPGTERTWTGPVEVRWTEQTEHYSDARTHDTEACGAPAETDVTTRITQYERWSMKAFAGTGRYAAGWRQFHPGVQSLKEAYGLRL